MSELLADVPIEHKSKFSDNPLVTTLRSRYGLLMSAALLAVSLAGCIRAPESPPIIVPAVTIPQATATLTPPLEEVLRKTITLNTQVSNSIKEGFKGLNPRPISTEGSVSLMNIEPHSGPISFGQGSLVESQNKLSLYTVTHVVDGVRGYMHIPLLNFTGGIEPYQFWQNSNIPSMGRDRVVSAQFDDSSNAYLQDLIKKNRIIPLTLDTKPLVVRERLAFPNLHLGTFTYFNLAEETSNRLTLQGFNGESVCFGNSGAPLLRLVDGKVTTGIVGFVSAVSNGSEVTEGCFTTMFAIPLR